MAPPRPFDLISRPRRQNLLTPKDRATYGITATIREQATGETRAIAETGMTAVNALRVIAAEIDALPGNWRVISLSTPETIYTDLQGARFQRTSGNTAFTTSFIDPYQAERMYLRRIGRTDLLEDRDWTPRVEAASRR